MNPNEVTIFLIEDDDVDAEAVVRAFQKKRIANKIQRYRAVLEGRFAIECRADRN